MKIIRAHITAPNDRQNDAVYNKIFRLLDSKETSLGEFDSPEGGYVVELNIQHDNVVGQMNEIPFVKAEVIEFPEEVMAILNTFEDETYTECNRLLAELEPLGWMFDYYLDASPHYVRKITEV